MIYTAVLVLSLFFLPIFRADDDDQQDIYIPHSIATRYLFDSSVRRLGNTPINRMIDQSQNQQREKRIYWENLAFHASDFNRKTKKFGRIIY